MERRIELHEFRRPLLAVVFNLALLLASCAFVLWAVASLSGAEAELRYEQIQHFGCNIFQTTEFNGRWQVFVWADYAPKKQGQGHDYEALASVRDSRRKALRDCDKWMTKVTNRLQTQRHSHGSVRQ